MILAPQKGLASLRKTMANSLQISWRRILAETLVITVSILLAFLIDAYWNGRIEQQREHEQLVSMRAEFEASLSQLDALITSVQTHAANVDSLIALLKEAGDKPVMVPGHLLGSAITWRTSDVSTSTVDALIASGDLNLLKNLELRKSLAGLPAFLSDITEDEIVSQTFAETHMAVFLAREGLAEIAYANRQRFDGLSAPGEISVLPTPELIGYLAVRRVHFWYSEVGLPTIQVYLEKLIEQIDNELNPKE